MVKIGDKIRARRIELGWSQAHLARVAGMDPSLLSRVEKGERRLNEHDLWKISDALGWSPERLFSSDSNVTDAPADNRRIPVLDWVQAGQWMGIRDKLDDSEFAETIGSSVDYPSNVFALRVRGNSMAPDYGEGDIVVIAPTVAPRPGDCVVATDENGEATFKKYRAVGLNAQGRQVFELVPLNPDYGSMRSDLQPISIVGTMLEHRRYRRN